MFEDIGTAALIAGLVGVVLNTAWPFFRGRTAMLVVQTLGAALFATHFALIGAYTGAVMLTFAGLQALAAIPLGEDPRFRIIYLATLPAIAIALALSWHGFASVFAAIGLALISIGRYQLKVIPFRTFLVVTIPFWTVHNLMVWSIPGLISDFFSFSSGAYMLWVAIREERTAAGAAPTP